MKRFPLRSVALALLFVCAILTAPAAQSLDADLQRVIQKESVATDLRPIIEEYRKIVARAGSNRALAARALLRIADCYQRIGDAESKRVLEQIVRDFADQKDMADEARTRLGGTRASAAPSGPSTRQVWSGADLMGSTSADGRLLSYTDWDTGDLAIRDLTTNKSRHVTNTGGWMASGDYAEYSLMSPDGRQVAVAWYGEKAPPQESYTLRVLAVDAGSRQAVDLARGPWFRPAAWLPDGKSLLAVRQVAARANQQSQLILYSVADRSAKVLKTTAAAPSNVTVSPDGRYAAYDPVETAGTPRQVRILSLADGTETPLALADGDRSPVWTPDGSRLLFLSERTGRTALWSIPVANGRAAGAAELFSADVSDAPLGISTSGTIYYAKPDARRNVYVVETTADMKTPGKPVLLSDHTVNANRSGAWSPDGGRIAYYTNRAARASEFPTLVIRIVATGEERDVPLKLHLPPASFSVLRWFPDGRSVLVASRAPEGSDIDAGFYRVDITTGASERLISADSPRGAEITPDGGAILYINRSDVFRFDLRTRASTKVTAALWYGAIAISPDGSQFAYLGNSTTDDSRMNQIAVAPMSGGPGRVLYRDDEWYDGTRFNSITWSRDGRYVFFVRAEGRRNVLWRVPVGGGAPEKSGLSIAGDIKALSAHPDGKRLAFTALEGTAEIWALDGLLGARRR